MVILQIWSLMEGEWSCYRSGHRWRGNGHVTVVVTNGGRMVLTEVVSLVEGVWLCYRGCRFNGGRMVMLEKWSL